MAVLSKKRPVEDKRSMFEIMNLCQTTSVFEDARNLIVLLSTVQVNEKIVHKQKIKPRKEDDDGRNTVAPISFGRLSHG